MNRTLSNHDSEDGARVGKMETERRNLKTAGFEKKLKTKIHKKKKERKKERKKYPSIQTD